MKAMFGFLSLALVWLGVNLSGAAAQCQPHWESAIREFSIGAPVLSFATFDDGRGPSLFAGKMIYNASQLGVSRWNGVGWESVGSGLYGSVYALTPFDDGHSGPRLYAGGDFTSTTRGQHISAWDGAAWSPLAGGLNDDARATAVFDDGSGPALYAGGDFTAADGHPASRLARWSGTSWAPVGGGVNGSVQTLLVFDDGSGPGLYIGGAFTVAGGVAAQGIAKWDGHTFSALGSGLIQPGGAVASLSAADLDGQRVLCAGGRFTSVDGVALRGIARWTGSSWLPIGGGLTYYPDATVSSIVDVPPGGPVAPGLYAGGNFFLTDGSGVHTIARWDGSAWRAVGLDIEGAVYALIGAGAELIAGGDFLLLDSDIRRVARWDGGSWSQIGPYRDGSVGALAAWQDRRELYVAGAFSDSGRVSVWNGAWRRAGSELNDSVEDLKVFQVNGSEHLYAAGVFVSPTGPSRVAEFDGQEWQPLGHDLDNPASSLVLFNPGDGPGLYVGGIFNIGSGLKRWNGTTWDNAGPIRCDCGGPQVGCTAVRHDAAGETLYVGGRFTYAGGVAVRNVASFDGQHWHALGSGLNGVLFAMADFDDGGGRNLYVGGVFDAAGAVSTHSIARWDGTQWRPLAENGTDGVAGTVAALAVFDDGTGPALYVGGSFSAAGGQPAANIAKWDGAHWHAVGSGVRGSVQAMAVLRLHGKRSLWVGGSFAAAGELPAVGLAEWVACPSCVADWNDSDTVTTDDFFAFLADFFDGHADVDQDGVTNTQDFFLFLNAFFAGCG